MTTVCQVKGNDSGRIPSKSQCLWLLGYKPKHFLGSLSFSVFCQLPKLLPSLLFLKFFCQSITRVRVISLIYPRQIYLRISIWLPMPEQLTAVVLKEIIIIAEMVTIMAECITVHCVKFTGLSLFFFLFFSFFLSFLLFCFVLILR